MVGDAQPVRKAVIKAVSSDKDNQNNLLSDDILCIVIEAAMNVKPIFYRKTRRTVRISLLFSNLA